MIVLRNPNGIVIVLQPENLARMQQGDPVTIPDLDLTICFESLPTEKLMERIEHDGALGYLRRGWQDHPDDYGPVVHQGMVKP